MYYVTVPKKYAVLTETTKRNYKSTAQTITITRDIGDMLGETTKRNYKQLVVVRGSSIH